MFRHDLMNPIGADEQTLGFVKVILSSNLQGATRKLYRRYSSLHGVGLGPKKGFSKSDPAGDRNRVPEVRDLESTIAD